MLKKIKEAAANIGLAAGSVVFTLLLIEFLIFPRILHLIPLRYQGYLHECLITLAQSSKDATKPKKDYIAILGDSFAAGWGDWVTASNEWTNPRHGVHHILHDKTKRDFVSFGRAGRGPLSSLAGDPTSYFDYLGRTWLYKIGRPKAVIFMFYEGNDLNNNFEDILLRYSPHYRMDKINDPVYFRKFLDEKIIQDIPIAKQARDFHWYDNFFFLRFIGNMINKKWEPLVPQGGESKPAPRFNRVLVGGKELVLPDEMDAPAMEIDDQGLMIPLYAFDQALKYATEYFRGTKMFIVYLPTGLVTYDVQAEEVSTRSYSGMGGKVFRHELLLMRHDRIVDMMRKITVAYGHVFVDATQHMRETASRELIHGPVDWNHYNKAGYEAVADVVYKALVQHGAV